VNDATSFWTRWRDQYRRFLQASPIKFEKLNLENTNTYVAAAVLKKMGSRKLILLPQGLSMHTFDSANHVFPLSALPCPARHFRINVALTGSAAWVMPNLSVPSTLSFAVRLRLLRPYAILADVASPDLARQGFVHCLVLPCLT